MTKQLIATKKGIPDKKSGTFFFVRSLFIEVRPTSSKLKDKVLLSLTLTFSTASRPFYRLYKLTEVMPIVVEDRQ